MERTDDFMGLYQAWERLAPGPRAELRRVSTPDELLKLPSFYRLFSGRGNKEWEKEAYQRLIYCLPYINHTSDDVGLGKALAKCKEVREKRLFQVIRSGHPNDMIQLRRILKMAEPTANWSKAAETLWYWDKRRKRDMLEQYFLKKTDNQKTI